MPQPHLVVWTCVGLLATAAPAAAIAPTHAPDRAAYTSIRHVAEAVDHSGRTVHGKASFYAKKFDGRKMANGRTYDPDSNVAASKTLPLGTTAKVVNLANGKTAKVKVEDRGPYVHGRVIDVTPKVAEKLHMKHKGTAPVAVKPILVPQPDGSFKLGTGAVGTPNQPAVQELAAGD